MSQKSCPTCKGYRLKKEALAVLIDGRHIGKITELSVADALAFFKDLTLSEKDMQIYKAHRINASQFESPA